jgi:hypothetical protein
VPGALMVPAIEEGVELVTRFNVADDAPGWLKLTVPPVPIENVPIDDGLVRALIDIERAVLGRTNRDVSRRDRASGRQLLRRRWQGRDGQQERSREHALRRPQRKRRNTLSHADGVYPRLVEIFIHLNRCAGFFANFQNFPGSIFATSGFSRSAM